MDSLLTPLPDKANNSKPKMNQKVQKGTGEQSQTHCRQNRVFGTSRSTNIQGKPVSDKSIITKTKIGVPHRQQTKPIRATQIPLGIDKTQATVKKSPENINPRLNKKSDAIPLQRVAEKTPKENESAEPKTPVDLSHVRGKSKVPATPFYTTVHCSKCRFDGLDTSSYWVGQIKMAGSVGKHFVASDFFRLALESQAEPIRNLRIELRRYLLRHGYLSEQKEWREVVLGMGYRRLKATLVELTRPACARKMKVI